MFQVNMRLVSARVIENFRLTLLGCHAVFLCQAEAEAQRTFTFQRTVCEVQPLNGNDLMSNSI